MNQWLATIEHGLTYHGAGRHILINYLLIGITLLPHVFKKSRENGKGWMWAFLLSLMIQMSLWFVLGAVGVSVIWSTLLGFNFMEWLREARFWTTSKSLFAFSLLMGLSGILYYGITFPVLTTVAHVVAFLLGIGLFFLSASILKLSASHAR